MTFIHLMRNLMTFLTLAGLAEFDLTIMANDSISQSREWMQSGVDRSRGTFKCRDFALFLELSSAEDGTMWLGGLEI